MRSVSLRELLSKEALPALPPALSRFLSPSLWEQLQVEPTRRGLLLDALNSLQTLAYQLATYLPRPLVEALKRDPLPGRVAGECLEGTLLFADVSGFTALSERLAAEGKDSIEALTAHLNAYFEVMLQILARSGGTLLKFAGDALLAYFPAQEDGAHALWASRAAQRMMRAMEHFAALETATGPVALRMKIALTTGPFLAAAVGTPERMEYILLGETVTRTFAVEGVLTAGQVGMDAPTATLLPPANCLPHMGAYFVLAPPAADTLDDFEIRPEHQRRPRESGLLMADYAELHAHIENALRQITALSAFLPAPLVAEIVTYAYQRHLPAENRPAAVLFFNFTGPEALWNPADPNTLPATLRALDACFNMVQESVARYEGVISRIDPFKQGSKILVLFGAPLAHEDDPFRAACAALDARARWQRDLGPEFSLRGGIAYGRTFAGPVGAAVRREYTVMGDEVNLAARLMAAAQPGQLLVTLAIAAAIETSVALTPLAPLQLKGKREPVPVVQLESLQQDPLAHRLQTRGPLIGRAAEMLTAQTVLRQALAGHGQLLLITGAAGMGKSHVADMLAAAARAQGALVHLSSCAPYMAASPYAPWTRLLRALMGLAPDAHDADTARSVLEWLATHACDADAGTLLQLLDLPALVVPAAFSQLPAPPAPAPARGGIFQRLGQQTAPSATAAAKSIWQLARERQRTSGGETWPRLERRIAERAQGRRFAAVERLLTTLAAVTPLVLIFEDVQWLDALSRQLLLQLSETLITQPILLVATARPMEDGPSWPGTHILLEPLTLAATQQLTAQLLGAALTPAELPALAQAVYTQTDGNPLFIEELCAWLRRTGRRELLEGLRSSVVLQELILSRLDALSPPEREVARVAAIVGHEFRRTDLLPLLPSPFVEQLSSALEGLQTARFILLQEQLLQETQAHYAFRQTLVRESLYAAQSAARRRALHRRLAVALQAQHAADPCAVAELLAYHFCLAAEWVEAARYALWAGFKAQQRAAFEPAAAHYTAALKALESLSASAASESAERALRGRAWEGLGDMALLQGRFADAGHAYAEASALLPTGPQLLARRAVVAPLLGELADALAAAQHAWELSAADDAMASIIAALLAWLYGHVDAAAARAWAGRTHVVPLAAYFAGELQAAWDAFLAAGEPVGAALTALRFAEILARNAPYEARHWLARAAELWTREHDAWGLALVRCVEAALLVQEGENGAADAARQTAAALLTRVGEVPETDVVTLTAWRQRYEDTFYALYLFNLLTVPLPEVQ